MGLKNVTAEFFLITYKPPCPSCNKYAADDFEKTFMCNFSISQNAFKSRLQQTGNRKCLYICRKGLIKLFM